jgi:hypothetical protein
LKKDKKKDKKQHKPGDLVALVEERVKSAEDWNERRQILAQVNYYLGNQWIYWNPTSKQMLPAPVDDGVERITHNVIKPRVMVKLAKQTKNRIKFDVIPDSNSQERIEIAKAADKFLEYWWDLEEMDRKSRDIFLNNNVKGYCAAKVFFDAEAGQEITPQEGEHGYEEGMNPLYTGEIRARICDPLTLFIDPAATSEDEIRWIVERKPRDVDYIEEVYGKQVEPEDNVDYIGNYEVHMSNGTGIGQMHKKNKNMAMVDEMWVKPCHKYPKGLKVTVAGGQLLDVDENAGPLPYFIFGDIPIPGSVKYDAFIKDMLPIQRNINIIKSMLATHAKRMGNSIWLNPLGSNVDEEELNDESGGILHYTPVNGAKPERVSPPDLPSFYDRILNNSALDIDDMSGAREISQGRLPGGLDTLGGLELMVEQENEKLAVSSQNYERGMKKLLQRVLMLMKKHYTEERMGRILGKDNEIELIAFTGADLSGGEDINIIQGSSLPDMKAAQQDRIMTMWGAGAIVKKDGTPDHQTLLRLMGMGDSNELFEMDQLDENKAKMENKTFAELAENPEVMQGLQEYQMAKQYHAQAVQEMAMEGEEFAEPPPQLPQGLPTVRDFYDHEIHIYLHNIFRKSSEYDQLPPEIQQLVDEHVQAHVEALQAPMMQEQQAQMEAQQAQQAEQQMVNEQQQAKEQQEMQLKERKLGIEEMKAIDGLRDRN